MGAPPFLWTQEIEDEVCEAIASGQSINEACLAAGMPSDTTVYRRMATVPAFADKMAKARAAQQDHEAEQCIKLADDATPEDWQVKKLQIWARQWRAAKLAPKKYGDKQSIELSGAVDVTGAKERLNDLLTKISPDAAGSE